LPSDETSVSISNPNSIISRTAQNTQAYSGRVSSENNSHIQENKQANNLPENSANKTAALTFNLNFPLFSTPSEKVDTF
jgi:hypothetical protein